MTHAQSFAAKQLRPWTPRVEAMISGLMVEKTASPARMKLLMEIIVCRATIRILNPGNRDLVKLTK